MKRIAIVFAGLLLGSSAGVAQIDFDTSEEMNAMIASIDVIEHDDHEGPCADLDLSEEQKEQIHELAGFVKRRATRLGRALKETHERYGRMIMSERGNAERASRLDRQTVELSSQMTDLGVSFRTRILFGIVEAEQRKQTAICMAHIHHSRMLEKLKKICEELED